jgi:hypothetical protein
MSYKSKCQRSLDLLLLIIVWSVVVSSQKDNSCSDDEGNIMLCTEKENSIINVIDKDDPPQQCQLYLAPSSIPNAGIGVYTSVPFQTGDRIGENELLIPIVHFPQDDDDGWLIDDVRWGVWIDPRLYYEGELIQGHPLQENNLDLFVHKYSILSFKKNKSFLAQINITKPIRIRHKYFCLAWELRSTVTLNLTTWNTKHLNLIRLDCIEAKTLA